MTGLLSRIAGAAVRRPLLTIGVVVALALAGGVLALRLRPSTATDTFVSAGSPAYRATVAEQRHFGSDAIVVLVHAPLTTLLQPHPLAVLTRLEACLAGQYVRRSARLRADVPVAAGSHAAYGGPHSPCGELMRMRAAHVVYGPGTFLNRAVAAVNGSIASSLSAARQDGSRAARAARRLALARGLSTAAARAAADAARQEEELRAFAALQRAAEGAGLSAVPSNTDAAFLRQVVFGAAHGATRPRARFAYLFPDADSALIQVRLRASLSSAEQARAIRAIRAAVRMDQFAPPAGGSMTVTGVPVVLHDLTGTITGAIGELLGAALLAMALALLLVFRRAPRLLPLAVALAATGITFGLLSVAGVGLTLASVAVLPILIGLAVDYGVQFQSRVHEAGGGADGPSEVADAITGSAPAILTAALATAVGFAVLWLSPVPMVRGFGLLLVVGIGVAIACSLLLVPAVLVASRRMDDSIVAAAVRGAREILAPSVRGAAEILRLPVGPRPPKSDLRDSKFEAPARGGDGPSGAGSRRTALGALARRPGLVLVVGLGLAAAGWALGGSTPVQSDVTKLVPQSMSALRDLRTLEATTGVSGEIDVAVHGRDVATPATVRWMTDFQSRLLREFGYTARGSCADATLCPALSLPDLFTATGGARDRLTQARIDALLHQVPGYFSSAVLTPDHHDATLAFGIRLMSLARQQRVIDRIRAQMRPPPGVTATLTGLPVLAAQAETSLAAPGRRLLTVVAGLIAVALVLLLVLRRPVRALVPMIPIVLATGWSGLLLAALGIPLNPMSATLGALVIAISTEFSVLLSERYRAERLVGRPPAVALGRTYRSTGRAVLASGVTAIVGFGVLVVSDIPMLRDFGLVTLVDLSVSLAGVLLVLPAALTLGERIGGRGRATGRRDDALGRARLRRRRRREPAGAA